MTRRDDGRAVTDYPEELQDGGKILGIEEEGSVVYWDPVREVVLSGEAAEGGTVSGVEVRRELGIDESLGDIVREIEESVGWESLSERAEELLGASSDSGSERE